MAAQHRRAVGVFPDRPRTASALQTLSDSGFAMSRVSIIAKDADRQSAIAGVEVNDAISNQADTGGAVGAFTGGVLGGVTGLLVGLGTLVIPGVGPALLAGEAAALLATVVGGATGAAAGGLVGALIGLGIPEHRAKHYRDRLAQGDYLVMLKDTEPEIARAERTLKVAGIEDWGVYHPSDDALGAGSGSPNTTFSGDGTLPNHARPDHSGVASGRGNPYNQVDHPMDQSYPPRETHPPETIPPVTGLPHTSNPVEPR